MDRETRIDVSFRNPHLIYHRLQLIADHDANFDVEDYGADFDAEVFEYIISDEELIAEIELEQSNTRCNNDDDCNSGFECSSGRNNRIRGYRGGSCIRNKRGRRSDNRKGERCDAKERPRCGNYHVPYCCPTTDPRGTGFQWECVRSKNGCSSRPRPGPRPRPRTRPTSRPRDEIEEFDEFLMEQN